MEFLDIGKRHRLVRVQNRRGQTPLHFAIAYKGSESSVSGGNEVMAAIQVDKSLTGLVDIVVTFIMFRASEAN